VGVPDSYQEVRYQHAIKIFDVLTEMGVNITKEGIPSDEYDSRIKES
jgi:hypothetical protein